MLIYIHYANKELNAAFCFLGHSLPRKRNKNYLFELMGSKNLHAISPSVPLCLCYCLQCLRCSSSDCDGARSTLLEQGTAIVLGSLDMSFVAAQDGVGHIASSN